MRNSKNIVELAHKQTMQHYKQGPLPEPICVSIPGPEPTLIVTATYARIYSKGVRKALELIRERQETKFAILAYNISLFNIDQVTNIVEESGFQCHRGPAGFNEEDSGCWIMNERDFDGMESRSVIVLDKGFIDTNSYMRCTTNLIVVIFHIERYAQGNIDKCKVIEI